MGWQTLINKNVATAFKILKTEEEDGLLTKVDYYQMTGKGTYDPAAGVTSSTEQYHRLDALRYQNRTPENDGTKIDINQTRLLVQSSELSFIPTKNDRVEIGDERFHVINPYVLTGGSAWILELKGT